jgi:CMP-N,N'-diacetyllegionaminic acid synthase
VKILYLIPAREGSKGLPGKNVKNLGGKSLISYSIDFVLAHLKEGDELCISTDDPQIIAIAKERRISIPFLRPKELASDYATSYDVIMHAIHYYESQGRYFDVVLLLQPTSPFRTAEDFKNLIRAYAPDIDMVVSVKVAKESPYFTIFEEGGAGYLTRSKEGNFQRRQDCPAVYTFNGSMYLMNVASLKKTTIAGFNKIKKMVMPEERSIDIDTMADWVVAEYYLNSFKF